MEAACSKALEEFQQSAQWQPEAAQAADETLDSILQVNWLVQAQQQQQALPLSASHWQLESNEVEHIYSNIQSEPAGGSCVPPAARYQYLPGSTVFSLLLQLQHSHTSLCIVCLCAAALPRPAGVGRAQCGYTTNQWCAQGHA